MGHSDLNTTRQYARVDTALLVDAHQRYSPILTYEARYGHREGIRD
jgi:hypothetical protein